ncbi:MAG: efflux RND transporter periplasmic adaptor subunit [Bryobacteraceae bacterium]|nr:efflux RND transporter periplasmic adaptor subunit [Bryobacteraceae bacterium]
MKRIGWLVGGLAVAAAGWWWYGQANALPEVALTRAERQRVESVLSTNGKAEPVEWALARAEREGLVAEVAVKAGQSVSKGAVLVTLDAREARGELASAEARIEQVRAEIAGLEQGGRGVELAEIESGLRRAREDAEEARREMATIEGLVKSNAAPRQELIPQQQKLKAAELQIRSWEERRGRLVDRSSVQVAQARLKEAQAVAEQARRKIELAVVRAPVGGVAYQVDARRGGWLSPGSEVAAIGQIAKLKVVVYVDEPELGRVKTGQPVRITWDAHPDQTWKGRVEQMPTRVVALNTRQVGEVVCVIENPELVLLPGTNVNAFIQASVVENALTIPKEALRREGSQAGVYVLEGEVLRWKPVRVGVSSVTRVEVLEGLAEGARVVLPSELTLRDGMRVRPGP